MLAQLFTKPFFTKVQLKAIADAIVAAEKSTSGEIRVHVENNCKTPVLERAAVVFQKLEMTNTKLKNGVLIYLAISDKKLAIVGDSGINAIVPSDFWDKSKEMMVQKFKNEDFVGGICEAIATIGEQLKTHFPFESNDTNELPNSVSFG